MIGALLLTLGGCGGGRPPATASALPPPPATASPSRADPGLDGCRALQSTGLGGTPEVYRHIAATTAGTDDARLGAAAVALYRATGPEAPRGAMLDAILDLAEECLRVTG